MAELKRDEPQSSREVRQHTKDQLLRGHGLRVVTRVQSRSNGAESMSCPYLLSAAVAVALRAVAVTGVHGHGVHDVSPLCHYSDTKHAR